MTTTNATIFASETAPSETALSETQSAASEPRSVGNTSKATIVQLKLAALSAVGFGIFSALGSHSATDAPARYFLDVLFLPIGEVAPTLTDQNQAALAILGGVMFSWGVFMWLITDALAITQPKLLKRIIFITLASWFVVDSIGSVASGAWFNVILNLGFGALFIVPARKL